MACVSAPAAAVGPTANWYAFPCVSVTEETRAVVSFQPTTTTFRFPADCAAVNGTATVSIGVCGVAEFTWTKAGPVCKRRAELAERSSGLPQPALATCTRSVKNTPPRQGRGN